MVGVASGRAAWAIALAVASLCAVGFFGLMGNGAGSAAPQMGAEERPRPPEPEDGGLGLGLPAPVSTFGLAGVISESYPSYYANGTPAGDAPWRVVRGTGNCCEHYLAATSEGRLVDFGGTHLVYSDDEGATWNVVSSLSPRLGGEGAVASAPGGDIVAVGWDTYSGDRVQAYHYDGATDAWSYDEVPLHTPAFDRPWIAAIPGPFAVGPLTFEYAVFLRGGAGTKEVGFLSLDGLHYVPHSPSLDALTESAVSGLVSPASYADGDWTQPNIASAIVPLGNGHALSMRGYPNSVGCLWASLKPSLHWGCYSGAPGGHAFLADSDGRLHRIHLLAPSYGISSDGGATWSNANIPLPADVYLESYDFKANADLGIAAVAFHVHNVYTNKDEDLVYKFDVSGSTPSLVRRYEVGLGDVNAGDSLGLRSGPRFDFPSVAILPSGKIAVSFIDSVPAIGVAIQE